MSECVVVRAMSEMGFMHEWVFVHVGMSALSTQDRLGYNNHWMHTGLRMYKQMSVWMGVLMVSVA